MDVRVDARRFCELIAKGWRPAARDDAGEGLVWLVPPADPDAIGEWKQAGGFFE